MKPLTRSVPHRIHRRFVQIGDRRTYYLRSGSGPSLVLWHAYPGSAVLMRRFVERYSAEFTCFVFETPGMGLSDPIAKTSLTITDVADAIADSMIALGLSKTVTYGFHSGGVDATELAARYPDLVSGLVVDGLPLYSQEEIRTGFDDYFRPFEPDPEGSHLSWVWTRFRDQAILFPWNRHHGENIRSDLLPFLQTPDGVHRTISGFYRGADYIGPYRSAVFYGEDGVRSVTKITSPAAFLEARDDVTHSLTRLPALRPNQSARALGPDGAKKDAVILEKMRAFASSTAAPRNRNEIGYGHRLERHFLEMPHGDILIRYKRGGRGRPLLLLHDAPGSARFLEGLVERLGQTRPVYAIDLPGSGESGPLPIPSPALEDFADAVIALLKTQSIERPDLYGCGFGSSLAVRLCVDQPSAFGKLILHGTLLPEPRERADLLANLCPPIVIKRDGSHWYATWQMLRDSEIFWPWYRIEVNSLRQADTDLSAERLHEWTVDVMGSSSTYNQFPVAALHHGLAADVRRLQTTPGFILDANHRFASYNAAISRLCPDATLLPLTRPPLLADLIENRLNPA